MQVLKKPPRHKIIQAYLIEIILLGAERYSVDKGGLWLFKEP